MNCDIQIRIPMSCAERARRQHLQEVIDEILRTAQPWALQDYLTRVINDILQRENNET
jgi:hypothetical protein